MKDRVGRQRNLMPTGCALPASLLCQFVGMSVPAARTREAVRPPTSGQILPAGLFVRKICLKFRAESSETQAAAPHYTTASGLLKQPDKQKLSSYRTKTGYQWLRRSNSLL